MHGIAYKCIRTMKNPPPEKQEERSDMLEVAKWQLKDALKKKALILFADECCFTTKTMFRKAFARKGENLEVD